MNSLPTPHSKLLAALLIFVHLFFTSYSAKSFSLPWLENIDPENLSVKVEKIQTRANVTVSDGLNYSITTFYFGNQRMVFQRKYEDRTITQGIDGKYIWEFDGSAEKEASNFVERFIKGHQFIALILKFDQFHPIDDVPQSAEFMGIKCMKISSKKDQWNHHIYYFENGNILGMKLVIEGMEPISFEFSDWKKVDGINLPHKVYIDDKSRQFNYEFNSIQLNKGEMNNFRAPFENLTDEQKLIRLHRKVMDGHLSETIDFLNDFLADTFTVVSSGEIYINSGIETNQQMNRLLSNRDYIIYDDLVRPIVKISNDGTLGWVIVQVYARGVRFQQNEKEDTPFEFTSSWIELYEKVEDKWKKLGNISNFK